MVAREEPQSFVEGLVIWPDGKRQALPMLVATPWCGTNKYLLNDHILCFSLAIQNIL
jgi:predicted KAP-like P-loop ATPase